MANSVPQSQNPKDTRGYSNNNSQTRSSDRRDQKNINNDWQYLNKNELPNNASTDQIFNAAYQNQGLQPQELGRKIEPEENEASYQTNYQSRENNSQKETLEAEGFDRGSTVSRAAAVAQNIPRRQNSSTTKKIAKKGFAKGRVSANTGAIFTWYGNLWLFIQLPIALIGFIGLALFFGAGSDSVSTLTTVADTVNNISPAGSIIRTAENLTGQDLSTSGQIDNFKEVGLGLFFICYLIILIIGAISFLIMYLEYAIGFSKSLSGNHSGFKTGSVLIAFIGYITPGFNVFPWLFVWVGAVWLYPE